MIFHAFQIKVNDQIIHQIYSDTCHPISPLPASCPPTIFPETLSSAYLFWPQGTVTQRIVLQFLLSCIHLMNAGFIPSYRSPMCKLGRERKAGEGIEQTCSGDDALYSTDSCGCGESTATNSTSEGPYQIKDLEAL